MSLSVFFPAYNDAPSLPALLEATFRVLEEHVADYEIIVVNDGSRDTTAEVLQRFAPRIRVVSHPRNRGYGGALRSGFELERQDPWHRVAIGKAYNAFARALFGVRLRDIDCDYRLVRRALVEHLDLRSTSAPCALNWCASWS